MAIAFGELEVIGGMFGRAMDRWVITPVIIQYGSVKTMQCLEQGKQEVSLLFQYLCV